MSIETDVLIAFAAVLAAVALGGLFHWHEGKKEEAERRNAKKDG